MLSCWTEVSSCATSAYHLITVVPACLSGSCLYAKVTLDSIIHTRKLDFLKRKKKTLNLLIQFKLIYHKIAILICTAMLMSIVFFKYFHTIKWYFGGPPYPFYEIPRILVASYKFYRLLAG